MAKELKKSGKQYMNKTRSSANIIEIIKRKILELKNTVSEVKKLLEGFSSFEKA